MVDQRRVQLRTKNPYNVRSNKRRVIKTPGGQLRYLHIHKKPTVPKCGDCGLALSGVGLYYNNSIIFTNKIIRFQLFAQDATLPSQSVKSPSPVLTVVAVVLTASESVSLEHSCLVSDRLLVKMSVFNIPLTEEAKIVKRVIKQSTGK